MKNPFPQGQELLLLLSLSCFCTLMVTISGEHDVALALLAAPLFVCAAMLGRSRDGVERARKIELDAIDSQ